MPEDTKLQEVAGSYVNEDMSLLDRFGTRAKLIQSAMRDPNVVNDLIEQRDNAIKAKREANAESRGRRTLIESIGELMGGEEKLSEKDLQEIVDIKHGLENGNLHYNELSDDEQEIALGLVSNDSIDPERARIPEEDYKKFVASIEKEQKTESPNESQEGESNNELETARTKLANLELRQQLIEVHGANPKKAGDLAKLYSPFDESTMEGKPQEEVDKAKKAHMQSFVKEHSWGFGTTQPMRETHQGTVTGQAGTSADAALAEANVMPVLDGAEHLLKAITQEKEVKK